MAEYGQSLEQAVWEFPLAVALVLMPVYAERKTGESNGPNYAQDEAIKARNKARAFLETHYNIIEDSSLPWILG